MRIPSQFNDDSLYRGRRSRGNPAGFSYRRLIRLSVALMLVLAVMQQAGKPAMYETFFGTPDDQAESDGNSVSTTVKLPTESASEQSVPQQTLTQINVDEITEATRESARLLVKPMSLTQQRQWTVVLDRWQCGESFRVMQPVIASTTEQVDQIDEFNDEQRQDWKSTLQKFGELHASPDRIPPDSGLPPASVESDDNSSSGQEDSLATDDLTADDIARLHAWLSALDQAAEDRVIDGAIWRSEDFDAFYRQLDQAPKLNPEGALTVAVVPLMQQPKTYLGSKVKVKGRVARATRKEATSNPFGVTEYWELWLRPSSGGDRPFVLIVPSVPKSVHSIQGKTDVRKGPEIEVIGRFFKRLGYASKFGADAAPVVIGRMRRFASNQNEVVAVAAPMKSETVSRLWTTIGIALLAGVSIAAFVMWRTSKDAKRSRQLRDNRRLPELFDPNKAT